MNTTTTNSISSLLTSFRSIWRTHSTTFISGLLGILIVFILVSSCGLHVEKRRFMKGYHISHNNKMKSSAVRSVENQSKAYTDTLAQEASREYNFGIHETHDKIPKYRLIESERKILFDDQIVDIKKTTNSDQLKSVVVKNRSENTKAFRPVKTTLMNDVDNNKSTTNGDGYLLLLAGFVGVSSGLIIHKKKKQTLKITRWAHKNKVKSRSLIILGQLGLGYLGYSVGGLLKDVGYEISEITSLLISGVTGLTFLYMYMKEGVRRNMWDLKAFFREKIGHVVLSVCLLGSSMSIGNGVVANILQEGTMGQLIHSTSSMQMQDVENRTTIDDEQEVLSSIEESTDDNRNAVAGIIVLYVFLALILTVGLAILSCAAICSYGQAGLLAVVLSIFVLVLFNIGMISWIKYMRRR
jgi:hypothetical protein